MNNLTVFKRRKRLYHGSLYSATRKKQFSSIARRHLRMELRGRQTQALAYIDLS